MVESEPVASGVRWPKSNWEIPANGNIAAFDPQGELIKRVATPAANVPNVHFGGPDRTTVFTTIGTPGEVWKFEWDRPGQPQYCEGT